MLRTLLATFALFIATTVFAQAIEPLPFKNHAEEIRYQQLTAKLRCPMCQNETLADSNAPIARDLRHQIFDMMQAGKTDEEIKTFLVDRYSNFVLYDPPLERDTLLLWFGPAVNVGASLTALTVMVTVATAESRLPSVAR